MLAGSLPAYAAGPNVTQHTKQEIIDYLAASESALVSTGSWSSSPDTTTWQSMGELSSSSKNSALTKLNNYRYIAGLDPVTLDSERGRLAQAAAYVDCSIEQLTHYPGNVTPVNPKGIPADLWQITLLSFGVTMTRNRPGL